MYLTLRYDYKARSIILRNYGIIPVSYITNYFISVSEVSTEGGIEETNEVVSSEPVASEDTKEDTPATEPEPAPEPVSSWWDYTASYTNKLKQSAQTLQQSAQQSAQTLQQSAQTLQQSAQQFDYNKLGEKIGNMIFDRADFIQDGVIFVVNVSNFSLRR